MAEQNTFWYWCCLSAVYDRFSHVVLLVVIGLPTTPGSDSLLPGDTSLYHVTWKMVGAGLAPCITHLNTAEFPSVMFTVFGIDPPTLMLTVFTGAGVKSNQNHP